MPSNKVLMLTADYYKRNSVVNLNVDEEILHPQIIKAQNVRIEKILGTNLFDTVLSEIDAQTYTARITTLLEDYIQPALVEWITYTALPYLNYKLTNKSVSKKSSDNSEPSDLNEVNYLRQNIRDDAEYYSERITKFLETNDVTYPEYKEGNTDCDDIKPSKLNFISGIYLG
mgnify:FL=1|tara:strand:- start:4756 stop:5271 length:516 start_codon:yes stop_codon:yes gene_type:complete